MGLTGSDDYYISYLLTTLDEEPNLALLVGHFV